MNSVLQQFDIHGRTAVVTGGTSGLGLACAEALAECGAHVTITGTRLAATEAVAQRLQARGWQVRAAACDVADLDAVAAVFDAHQQTFGGLDIVFANAGAASGSGFMNPDGSRATAGQIDTIDPEHWYRTIDVNLLGAFHTVRHAARLMKQGGKGGSIVVTSSNASTIAVPIVGTAYMAAKAGVAHFVRTTALELADFQIRINAMAPGSFVTNIGGGVLHDPVVRSVWDKKVPLGAMAHTDAIKPLALYLASDASRFVTGAEMVIDGGVCLAGH